MAKTKKYVPTTLATAEPRHQYLNGVLVGIGGKVLLSKPPMPTVELPEATQEQYAKLFELGYTHLIKEVEE